MATTRSEKLKRMLGVSHGAAANQLRKAIMFQLVQEAGKDMCYQCGKKIATIDQFSIEHMQAWQKADNPKKAFFDLGNISFSHLKCNVAAGDKGGGRPNYHLGRETVAKLTKEQASEVKQLLRDGAMPIREIGAMYGVHHSSIWAISSGKSWKDA